MTHAYPIACPHCGEVIDSMDSMADSRADLDTHLLHHHPDQPDPTHDPRLQCQHSWMQWPDGSSKCRRCGVAAAGICCFCEARLAAEEAYGPDGEYTFPWCGKCGP